MGKTTPSGGAQAPARAPRSQPKPPTKDAAQPAWRKPFLAALVKTRNVRAAYKSASIGSNPVYRLRQRDAGFAAEWKAALDEPECRRLPTPHWRREFLAGLVATSGVTAAAAAAKVTPSRAYRERAINQRFAAQWRIALHEGYELLEMEVLAYLRRPGSAIRMDVAGATRLLAAHRDEVAQQRALIDHRSEREVLDSIDAMIDQMREREAANAAILARSGVADESGGNENG